MHVTIVTAFPEFFRDFLSTSIVGRAVKRNLLRVDLVDLREFGRGGYRQIDDYAFGAGGMVLAAPQLEDALNAARGEGEGCVVYPSPQGTLQTQEIVETLSRQEHVVILCGHYEGIDERFVEREVDLEVRVGDCVLTGGEIPAMAIIDAMARLVPGVVGRGEAVEEDSFYRGMLDHPHYTRPASWRGMDVPEVLLSGNEAEVRTWRRARAVERTLIRRPDLLARAAIGDYLSGGARLALLTADGPTPEGAEALSSLCRFYGLGRPFFVILRPDERRSFDALSAGASGVPRVLGSLSRVWDWARSHGKGRPTLTVVVEAQPRSGSLHTLEAKRRCLEHDGPLLFLFPDGVEAGEIAEGPAVYASVAQEAETLPLAVRAGIALDRFLGKR